MKKSRFLLPLVFAMAIAGAITTKAIASKEKFTTYYWTADLNSSPPTNCTQITDCDEVTGSTCNSSVDTYKSTSLGSPCATPVALFRHP